MEFACDTCGKPFRSESLKSRHALRCKMRRRDRKKACMECARSKTRCDQKVPSCTRCFVKSISCNYHSSKPESPRNQLPAVCRLDDDDDVGEISQRGLPESSMIGPAVDPMPSGQPNPAAPLTSTADELGFIDMDWPNDQVDTWPWGDSIVVQPSPDPLAITTDFSPSGKKNGQTSCSGRDSAGSRNSELLSLPLDSMPPFARLSQNLANRWKTSQQAFDFVDITLVQSYHNIRNSHKSVSFIHHQHLIAGKMREELAVAVIISQLHMSKTSDTEPFFADSVSTQLSQINMNFPKYGDLECLAAVQAIALYLIMSVYNEKSSINTAVERICNRLIQHLMIRRLVHITSSTYDDEQSWEAWIIDESFRRVFFILHLLDYVTHARRDLPPIGCPYLHEMQLPSPEEIWRAESIEAWESRRRAWRRTNKHVLKGKHIISWRRGDKTGYEEPLVEWFQNAGDLGELILITTGQELALHSNSFIP